MTDTQILEWYEAHPFALSRLVTSDGPRYQPANQAGAWTDLRTAVVKAIANDASN